MNTDIYAIYRACRLCGVGAGYKMPIVQSIVEVDEEEIELRQKIKECLQLEVSLQDRMPPLICELCVDKVHEFYEFRKMCQETNRRTRMRLGLPLQAVKSVSEAESILGVTEQITVDSDEGEPLVKPQTNKPRPKSAKTRKEPNAKIKDGNPPIVIKESRSPSPEMERRETRGRRAPSPRRLTRQTRTDDMPLCELRDETTPKLQRVTPGPKSVLRSRERLIEATKEMSDDEDDEDSLLVLRHKRPREVFIETPPVVKKSRPSEPARPERTKPGPKSSKEAPKPTPPQKPPPKAGPKSKTRETLPAVKSQKSIPGPKSRKTVPESEESQKSKNSDTVVVWKSKFEDVKSKSNPEPQSTAKSTKRVESSPVPMSRVKKRNASPPAPRWKKAREASPAAPERPPEPPKASPTPQKAPFVECNICGVRAKGVKALNTHMKSHVPTFTIPKLSCNACELWFTSAETASCHHRQHAASLPYTCSKCYDDFKTANDYELHFVRNQCLPTYEVPDVKCDECWKMFPTYKLLEDHRCPGEGGRPGGKCPKCKRIYASLKSLTLHEMRCTVKKKGEQLPKPEETSKVEVVEDSRVEVEESSREKRGMLPMRVRLVRCDLLLPADGGRYRVHGLSPKFGLDRSCTYPYLSNVKSEPSTSEHTVAIRDDNKQEYTTEDNDTVHWDSDDSDDNRSVSNKSVDSLSAISLKTLFSQKCLGEVQRKKLEAKLKVGVDSILDNDSRDGAKSRLDQLVKESNSDYDSDSILERKADSADLFDIVKNSTDVSNAIDEGKDMTSEQETGRTDAADVTSSNTDNLELHKVETNESNDQNTDSGQNDNVDEKTDEVANCETKLLVDADIKPESSQKCREDSYAAENVPTADDVVSQNDNCKNSPKNGHLVSNKIIDEESLSTSAKVENGKQSEVENMDVDLKESRSNDEDVSNSIDSSDVERQSRSNIENVSNLIDSGDVERESRPSSALQYNKDEVGNELDPKSPEATKTNLNDVETTSYPESDDKLNERDSFVPNGETNENDNVSVENRESNENESYCETNDQEIENNDSYHTTNDKTDLSNVPYENDDQGNENDNSSYAINDKVDKTDKSEVNNDASNNSVPTESCSQKDLNDTSLSPSKDVVNEKEDTEPNLIDSKESLITENELFETEKMQSIDKFDMNYLDEEDKLLMAELDAQIGESEPESNASENKNVIGENRSVVGENSGVIGENSAVASENSNVVAENSSNTHCSSVVNNSEDKSDALANLMHQNNLRSLDLDTISDEEFNFDI